MDKGKLYFFLHFILIHMFYMYAEKNHLKDSSVVISVLHKQAQA